MRAGRCLEPGANGFRPVVPEHCITRPQRAIDRRHGIQNVPERAAALLALDPCVGRGGGQLVGVEVCLREGFGVGDASVLVPELPVKRSGAGKRKKEEGGRTRNGSGRSS